VLSLEPLRARPGPKSTALRPPRAALPTVAVVAAVALSGITPVGYPDPFPGGDGIPGPLDRITLLDLALVVVLVAVPASLPLRAWLPRPGVARVGLAAAAVIALASFALHPSALGVEALLRWGTAFAIVTWLAAAAPQDRRTVAGAVAVAVAAQAAIGLVQARTGQLLMPDRFEWYSDLWVFGGVPPGRAGSATRTSSDGGASSLRPSRRTAGGRTDVRCGSSPPSAGSLAAGLSCSRAVALGVAATAVVVVLWPLPRPRPGATRAAAWGLLALAAGTTLGIAATADGWAQRIESSSAGSATDISTSRTTRWSEALDLFTSAPVLGVGPGNYLTELAAVPDPPVQAQPAHQTLLQAGASVGAGGILLTAVAAVGTVVWAARRRHLAAPLAALTPAFLLDPYPIVAPGGIVLAAVAVGLVVGQSREGRSADAPPLDSRPPGP
jgi:hypothetical protein